MDKHPHEQQSKHDRSRTKWTSSLDKIFVDLVLEQVLLGNRSNNVFNKVAWKHIRDEFNKQTSLEFDRKQLKKHLDVLRNRYENVKSQFGGDESSRHTGGELWDDYMEEAETSRMKDFPIYDQLCKIFSEAGGIGRYAQSSHYVDMMDKETILVETPRPACMQDESSSHSAVIKSSSRKRKRNKSGDDDDDDDDALAEAMVEMASASKLRANALLVQDHFSITKCVQALDSISDVVDESLYYAALDLFENPNMREMFLSLKMDKQLMWLHGKCPHLS